MSRRNMRMYMRARRMTDGRNPYGSAGGYVSSRRARRDGLMMDDMRRYNRGEGNYDLAEMTRQNQEIMHDPYMPRDYQTGEVNRGDFAQGRRGESSDYARGRNRRERADYGYDYDMDRNDYADMRDMHYGGRESNFRPVEAMGYFKGYYGGGEEDFARRREMDYARGGRGRGRNSRANRDYNMDYADYGYDYADYGYDYGSMELEDEDLEEWAEDLKKELEEKDKQFFSKEHIKKKAEEMGIKFEKFSMPEFYVTVLMMYTDYCKTLGTANMDIYLRLAKDWLEDKDVSVKGGEKLAAYYENIVDAD